MSASPFPPLQSKPSGKHCSNCSAKMALYALPGHYNRTVEIDVCVDCNAIWFDQYESSQLSSDATVALFQLIHDCGVAAAGATVKFNEGLRCLVCNEGMKLTHDQAKGTRFSYQACRRGHGRLSTFYNFLAEKRFVRELTKGERAKLASMVEQIRCSGCGAAVDIGKVDACAYCRAPLSVFDRDAAKQAIDHYLRERHKPPQPSSERRQTTRDTNALLRTYERSSLGADILFAIGNAVSRGVSGAARNHGGGVLPDATHALFGSASNLARVESTAAFSSIALEALNESNDDGVLDLVSDGIDSLLGSLFN